MSYKVGFYGGATGNTKENPAFNQLRFDTPGEADAYGNDLLSRWTQPSDFVVLKSSDPTNAWFGAGGVTRYEERARRP